jgi:hypothetical protein
MKSDIIIQLHKNFEDYAHQVDDEEFWFARELQSLLGYIVRRVQKFPQRCRRRQRNFFTSAPAFHCLLNHGGQLFPRIRGRKAAGEIMDLGAVSVGIISGPDINRVQHDLLLPLPSGLAIDIIPAVHGVYYYTPWWPRQQGNDMKSATGSHTGNWE